MKLKWFKKQDTKNKIPETGCIYVVDAGTYGGEYMVLMEVDLASNNLKFLILPDFQIRDITLEVFNRGLDMNIVKLLEKLPNKVYKTCKQQYDLLNNSI